MRRPASPKEVRPVAAAGAVGYRQAAMGTGSSRLTITAVGDDPRHLDLSGDLDSFTAPDLAAALEALGEAADVVIELSGVAFIDSSGLRTLVATHTALDEQGHRLVLVAPSRTASRLFEISGLHEHFHLA